MNSNPVQIPAVIPGPDDLVRDLEQLPATAAILPRLLKLLESDSASIGEVIELIRVDQAITARTLQMGGSAYYSGKAGPCENVEDAVNRVGFNQVYKLVSYAATAQLLMRPLGAYGLEPADTWRQSVACALAAEQLATHTGVNHSVAYTAGLLHNVGMIAIDTWRQQQWPDLRFTSEGIPRETTASETQLLGYTNASVGAALLTLWEFPPDIVEPVGCQYDPSQSRQQQVLACLLHVAKWLRDAAFIPVELPLPPTPESWILETLKVAPESLETRLYEVRDAFEALGKLLE